MPKAKKAAKDGGKLSLADLHKAALAARANGASEKALDLLLELVGVYHKFRHVQGKE